MNSKSFRNQQSLKHFTRREGTQAERSSSVCTCDSNQNNCSSTLSGSLSSVCVDGLFVRLFLFSSNHLSVKTCLSTTLFFQYHIAGMPFRKLLFQLPHFSHDTSRKKIRERYLFGSSSSVMVALSFLDS